MRLSCLGTLAKELATELSSESATGKTKADVQAQVGVSNIAAITGATDADVLLAALKVLELENVVDANKDLYLRNRWISYNNN